MRFVKSVQMAVVLIALSSCGAVLSSKLYPGAQAKGAVADLVPPEAHGFEAVNVTRHDGAKRVMFWRRAPHARGTVIYLHGNGATAENLISIYDFQSLQYNFAVVSYTGYGPNSGKPSEAQLLDDVAAAVAEVKRRTQQGPVFLVGSSLGGSLAILAQERVKVDAMITFAAFTRIADLAPKWAKTAVNAGNAYDAIAVAPHVRVPWVIAHCENDEVIPPSMSSGLLAAAQSGTGGAATIRRIYPCDGHPVAFKYWGEALADLQKLLKRR